MTRKILFLFISIILSNDVNQKPQITEKIIKEIHYGYHHLKAASTRQKIKMVYAPDTTPHGYPSWPYMHISETDTLFFESNYYISDKSANYDNEYFRPNHIKVKRDTLIQFIKQIDELKTRYRINDQKKQIQELRVTKYEHYNRYNKESSTGIIVNNISSNTSIKRKEYFYHYNRPNYEFTLYNKNDSRFNVYYPFFKVKDSTLSSIKYTFSSNENKYLYKQIYYKYALNLIDDNNSSFIVKINHSDFNKSNFRPKNISLSLNSNFRDYFNFPPVIPKINYCEEGCPPDSLSFFIDSLSRTVKRKVFYIPDDCSYGGYATTDSIFNTKGQLIIEKPGYHYNGTTMGPSYSIKEFKYYDNGQVSDIISDGGMKHIVYNRDGQIVMKKESNPDDSQKTYKYDYDNYGNLISFSYNFNIGTEYSESYKNKYEHVYNDKGLLVKSYIHHYQSHPFKKKYSTNLLKGIKTYKYLISEYHYDQYDRIISKKEYIKNNSNNIAIPSGINYGNIYKLITYRYK